MLRCALTAMLLAATLCGAAGAQTHRPFPVDALRGDLRIGVAPEALLNDRPARLAPGARIRGETNLLVLPGELSGKRLLVHYTQEGDGLIKDVWILNSAERANARWPRTRQEAAQWQFDPASQTWSRP